MRVLYIHQYFTTPGRGGATRSFEFSKRLAARGHKVLMVTGTSLPPEAWQEIPAGVTVVSSNTPYSNSFSGKRRIISFLHFAFKAIRLGWNFQPDVIIATSTPLTVGLPALVLSWRHRAPFVFEVRDLWPEAPIQMGVIRNPIIIRLLRWFEKLIYEKAVHVIALSPGMREGILRAGVPSDKVTVIPNSSDVGLFQPGPVDTEFLLERGLEVRPTIAYAGTLGEANAIDVLGAAAVELKKRKSSLQIVVAGDGKYRQYLDRLIEREGLDNLVLLGKVSKQDVARLYKASMAGLVLFSDVPILQTNSPNKFFDLLAAGRPVITNMRGWIAELVREHDIGYVAEGSDVQGLTNAMLNAATGERFEEMAANARRLAEQEFDRDSLARIFESVLLGATERVRAK